MSEGVLWRVGYRADPLAFTPHELCSWNHRFDDPDRRFRTIYCSEHQETSRRKEHLLAPTRMQADGGLVDLTEAAVRAELESRHAALLIEHGLGAPRSS